MKIICPTGILLISHDNYEKFLRDAVEHINSLDKELKQRTDETLKAITSNYLMLLSERLQHELDMVDESEATGNAVAANHHRVLAEVYRSMLDGRHEEKIDRQ